MTEDDDKKELLSSDVKGAAKSTLGGAVAGAVVSTTIGTPVVEKTLIYPASSIVVPGPNWKLRVALGPARVLIPAGPPGNRRVSTLGGTRWRCAKLFTKQDSLPDFTRQRRQHERTQSR